MKIYMLIKPKRNEDLKELVDKEVINTIQSSNLIILFGLSLGNTDKFWWELVGKHLLKNTSSCKLILFNKGKDIPANLKYKRVRIENKLKDYFLSQTNLSLEDQQNIKNQIYVGYNTNMFNIIDNIS